MFSVGVALDDMASGYDSIVIEGAVQDMVVISGAFKCAASIDRGNSPCKRIGCGLLGATGSQEVKSGNHGRGEARTTTAYERKPFLC